MPPINSAQKFQASARGPRSRWMIIALAIPVVLLVIAGAILIWPIDNSGDPYPAKAYLKYATPTSLAPLLNDELASGDQVFLNEVHLTPASTDEAFLARGAHGRYVLVIANGKLVSIGDEPAVANVQGVVKTLPSKSTLKREWKLTNKELALIAGEQYYVDAQRIHIDSRTSSAD